MFRGETAANGRAGSSETRFIGRIVMKILYGMAGGAICLGLILPLVCLCGMPAARLQVADQFNILPIDQFVSWIICTFGSANGVFAGAVMGAGAACKSTCRRAAED